MESAVTRSNLANYASAWSRTQYSDRGGLFPIEQQLVNEFFPRPPADVLDLGCGGGRTTTALHGLGYRVIGIDLAETLVAAAREKHPELDVRVMDATALQFADGSFDAALFSFNGIDCLYPVSAREQCLREAFRVLRSGGVFLLSTHNAIGAIFSGGYFYLRGHWNAFRWLLDQAGNPHRREWYWRYDDPGGTQFLYSAPPDRTTTQAAAAGFDVIAVRGHTGEERPDAIRRHQQHVYFVLKRP